MNAFHDGVGFEQKQLVRQAEVQHGAIVARAGHNRLIDGQRFRQPGDEFKFIHDWPGLSSV